MLTGEDESVLEKYTYRTYGELLSGDTCVTPYLYNGQYGVSTDGNGLFYMRSRYYSTDMKQFISKDVVRGDLTESQSLNRYCYVQGNPVSYTDPFGLSPYNPMSIAAHGILTVLSFALGAGNAACAVEAGLYKLEGNSRMAATMLVCAAGFAGAGKLAGWTGKGLQAAGAAAKGSGIAREVTAGTGRMFTKGKAGGKLARNESSGMVVVGKGSKSGSNSEAWKAID